jgi:hypothetical protein
MLKLRVCGALSPPPRLYNVMLKQRDKFNLHFLINRWVFWNPEVDWLNVGCIVLDFCMGSLLTGYQVTLRNLQSKSRTTKRRLQEYVEGMATKFPE